MGPTGQNTHTQARAPVLSCHAMRASIVVVTAMSLAACPAPESDLPFAPASMWAAPDPAVLGPYPVGVRTVTFTDPLRVDDETGEPRTLVTEIWYPAVEDARDGPFHTYVLYDELPDDLRPGLTPEDLGSLQTRSVKDAAPRDDGTQFPVVVFSHGKGGIRQQSTFYTVFLASHGYVVASPDHTGDTVVDLLRELKTNGDVTPAPVLEALVDRPYDVSTVLDGLESLGDDPLGPLVDMDRVGVTGHSFGALTSFIVATTDARIDVVVGQTPTSHEVVELQSRGLMAELKEPALVQSAGLDRTLPEDTNAQPLYENVGSEKAWLTLFKGGHFTYSDLCVLDVEAIDAALEIDASNVLTDGCGVENVPTDEAFPAIRASAIGWFNRFLRGSLGSKQYLSQETLDQYGEKLGTFTSGD
jgi:dienelactone hydrolase